MGQNSSAELVEEYWVTALVWSLTLGVVLHLLLKGHLYYWLYYVTVLVILTHSLPIIMLRKHSNDKMEDQLIQIFRVHCYFPMLLVTDNSAVCVHIYRDMLTHLHIHTHILSLLTYTICSIPVCTKFSLHWTVGNLTLA
jgi:uncharacterized membrane protein YiaA